ncbi:MAG: zinc-dependent metalloprotease [Planctomycetota bacterium]
MRNIREICASLAVAAFALCSCTTAVLADDDFPPLEDVIDGYEEISAPTRGNEEISPFMQLWKRDSDGQMLAELPKNYTSSKHREFIATTIAGGEEYAGLQNDNLYVYWRKYGKRVALIAENLDIRGSDDESKSSVGRIFTDTVLLDLPILCMGPNGGPVIDLDSMLVGNANTFLSPDFMGSFSPYFPRTSLLKIKTAKVFENNIEVAFEAPMSDGTLKTMHFSISQIEGSDGYKPRMADQRVGYFTTSYADYGQYDGDDSRVRYINRWHLEKRDDDLQLSPPVKPIVFYIEHTTPVRYRRWVRDGILSWNRAFEEVGILNAIEVRQQDQETGLHMDKDPEDVQYNFVRWLNNNISTAIGPSRVNPKTGEILDADIVLTDGWIRTFEGQFTQLMPETAMQGMTDETKAWFATHPNWDPRVRLAHPSDREFIRRSIAIEAAQAHSPDTLRTRMMGDEPWDGLIGRSSQMNGGCTAAEGRQMDVALMRMTMAFMRMQDEEESDEESEGEEEEEKDEEQMLDGMPESFIGPLLADLVAHEVGHTLGLRHNFKASALYTMAEMNSEEIKGNEPFTASVMDYNPTNFNFESGEIQGDYAMIGIGEYDMWAIEYGYTLEGELDDILERCNEPALQFGTDEDTGGPDPLARRYDFSKNPLDFAENQIRMAQHHRGNIIEKFVEEGDSWDKARQGYLVTLSLQTRATGMMANWIGGTFVHRNKKGDPEERAPLEVVPVDDQRKALEFVLQNSMYDEAFGLTPELLIYMTNSAWRDRRGRDEAAWPVHDRIMSTQASTLSQLLNPTVLRRVYDNEFRIPADQDALTMVELVNTVTNAVWSELDDLPNGNFTERSPAMSSLRRNLQTEYLDRLFDLANEEGSGMAAMKPISDIATMTLKDLNGKLEAAVGQDNLDAYSRAHLMDSQERIEKWLESLYVVGNGSGGGGGMPLSFLLGEEPEGNR